MVVVVDTSGSNSYWMGRHMLGKRGIQCEGVVMLDEDRWKNATGLGGVEGGPAWMREKERERERAVDYPDSSVCDGHVEAIYL